MPFSDRNIVCPGLSNLRDLGGYATADGHKTKYRRLYRSAELTMVPKEDAEEILRKKLNIAYTVDFRGVKEAAARSYEFEGITRVAVPVSPGNMPAFIASVDHLTAEDATRLLTELNEEFVMDFHELFTKFLRTVIDVTAKEEEQNQEGAILFHCTAGKDRTGWGAALLLSLLGVSEEDIMKDYLLTNTDFVRPEEAMKHFKKDFISEEALNVLWSVNEAFLTRGLTTVKEKYGSMEAYAKTVMGITDEDIKTLRTFFVE